MKLFEMLTKPKWNRGELSDRLRAVKAIETADVEALKEAVINAEDEQVRLAACKKVADVSLLETLIQESTCSAVQALAGEMANTLIKHEVLNAGDDWAAALGRVSDQISLAEIVLETENVALRNAAVERVVSQDALMKVVTGECGKDAGMKAMERLDGEDILDVIANDGGNKAVRHAAKRRLEDMRKPEEEAAAEPVVDITAELTKLVGYAESVQETYNFEGVSKVLEEKKMAWKALDANLESPLFPRFQAALDVFENRRNDYADKQAQQLKRQAEQQALKEQKESVLAKLETLAVRDEGIGETLENLKEEWGALVELANTDTEESLQRSFSRLSDDLERGVYRLAKETDSKERLEKICADLEAVLEAGDERALKSNKSKTWKQPTWDYYDPEPLKQRFNKAVGAIKEKLTTLDNERVEKQQETLDELNRIVSIIKDAVDAENRKEAMDNVKGVQERWEELDGWSHAALTRTYKELLDAFWDKQRESREERDWQEWANKGIKEKLIQAVEATASIEDPKLVAKIIREAQKKWKTTGPVPHKDNEPMWQRFHEICETNYLRCKEFFDEKDKERQANVEICTALCDEADGLKESDDWGIAVKRYKEMQKEWKAHGSLPRAQADDLYNRFRTACDAFFERFGKHREDIDSHREENQAAKEELVKKAEALLAEEGAGPDAFIALQKEWKELGPGIKEKDEETWQAFRTACDTCFAKLEEEHIKNVPLKEKLCEQAELLVADINDETDRKAMADSIIALQKEWKDLGPLPKSHDRDLSKRFRKACNSFFDLRREEYAAMSDEREQNLAIKRDLVTRAEELAGSDDWKQTAIELKELQAEWKTIGPVPREHDREVWQAFRSACDQFFARRKEQFDKMDHHRQENLCEKEELLANLERIIGAESAKDDVETQKESTSSLDIASQLQVAFASNFAMAGGSSDEGSSDHHDVRRIQERWKQIGPVPREKNDELWKRYKSLLDAFYGNE